MSSGPARVLEALRRAGGRTCSGATLSSEHGVSRAQVWKDVQSLRDRGYAIEAAAGEGYRLVAAPDRLYPEEIAADLKTNWLAREVRWLDSVDSTNRVAAEWARRGAPHGAAVVAEGQTAGRGRLGRSFYSPPYQNLYTSLVLRPDASTSEVSTWVLSAAVAVAESVAAFLPEPEAVEIKWPNDVLIGGLKTSGILMELAAEATRVSFLVLGIGVNLNVRRQALPEEFRDRATSLRSERGARGVEPSRVDRLAFTRHLYAELEGVLDAQQAGGFDALRPRFEARFGMAGRPVRVSAWGGDGEVAGIAVGIAEDGALRLRDADGRERRVLAGDVTVVKPPAEEVT